MGVEGVEAELANAIQKILQVICLHGVTYVSGINCHHFLGMWHHGTGARLSRIGTHDVHYPLSSLKTIVWCMY